MRASLSAWLHTLRTLRDSGLAARHAAVSADHQLETGPSPIPSLSTAYRLSFPVMAIPTTDKPSQPSPSWNSTNIDMQA
eukprot:1969480-Pleurochrysis_carterae.AAC.10